MTIDRLINVLVTILLVEMMAAIGLGVKFSDLAGVLRNWRLVARAVLANYVCVPAVTVGLLVLFHPADPMVPVGFLILAVCPAAPFGPPCTRIAGGNVPVAVGLMVILAASSALAAPLLLHLLLPWMTGDATLQVNSVKIVGTLLATQLLPLGAGLLLGHWRPRLAQRLQKPASLVSAVLGLVTVGIILVVQASLLADIGLRGWTGMFALLIVSCASGWFLGGPGNDCRKALALTTSLRNVGVGLVIAVSSFPGTAAVTAALAYGIFVIVGSLLLALAWARREASAPVAKAVTSGAPPPTIAGDRPS